MKKRALRKDFYMEVKKSLSRFISITLIVALGVAFYSGIQSAAPDMRYSGDAYFDEHKLMDLKVIGTLGLTEEDVQALLEISGIAKAEPGYMMDVLCGKEDAQQVLHLEAISETLNQLTPAEGRVPENPGEVFVDIEFLDKSDYKIGDQITFYLEDEDDLILKRDTFTIVGAGSSPLYISFNRGNTTLGNGEISGAAYILPEDFDSEVYTQIYIEAEEARNLTAYTDAYDTLIERVMDKVEAIEGARCEIRYQDVMDEANEKLEDAKEELADGKAEAESELTDARRELAKGERELRDGIREYNKGKQEVAEAESELADGEKELADAKATLSDKQQELDDGKAQLASGWSQLKSGKKELAKKEKEFNSVYSSKIKEIEDGETALKAAKAELADGKTQYEQGKAEYESGLTAYEEGEKAYAAGLAEYEAKAAAWPAQRQEITDGITQAEAAKAQLEAQKPEAEAARGALQAQAEAVSGQVAVLQGQAAELENQKAAKQSEIDGYTAEIANLQAEAAQAQSDKDAVQPADDSEEAQAEAEAKRAQFQAVIDNANARIAECNGLIAGAQAEISGLQGQQDGINGQIADQQGVLGALQGQIAEIDTQLGQLEGGISAASGKIGELNALIVQGDQGIEAGKTKLAQNRALLDEKKAELDAAPAVLEETKTKLDAAEKEIAANEKKLTDGRTRLESGKKQISQAKKTLAANEQKLNASQAQLTDGESQIASGWQEIADAEKEIEDGKKELADAKKELKDAKKEIEDGKAELADGKKEYEDGKREADEEIADAEQKIADAEKEISEIEKPEWIISDRSSLPENIGYGENADRMRAIGQVFPVLFFLVAALISLTTMTRMVEEERTQIGTLKALGYGKTAIAGKYICYALAATLTGSVAGVLFGEKFLPFVIVTAYKIMYHHMPNIELPYNIKFALIGSGAALIATIGATLAACFKELAATPAVLMRPPAPKEGKRVLLEKITFIWKRLNFTWKSTVRNLFRYKKRFLMTVLGMGGCMALMIVGYGLRDSIQDIGKLQYGELQKYQGMVILNDDASAGEKQELVDMIAADSRVNNSMEVLMEKDTVRCGKKHLDIYLTVPKDIETYKEFVVFRDRNTQEGRELTQEGAILTEKIAKMTGVEAGDTIVLENDDFGSVEIPVAGITENYLSHYIYLTPELYEKCFGEKPVYNEVLYQTTEEYEDQAHGMGEEFLRLEGALSVSYTDTIAAQLENMLSALDLVIVVLIISAGLLAFVVLYNLNNININERRRELATIKVLGFFDGEVSAYVYRENILITFISIAAGVLMGIVLHRFVIETVEVDACMFGRNINLPSFITASLFTAAFSIFVNVVMHFKLKKIDMVESLKSVE